MYLQSRARRVSDVKKRVRDEVEKEDIEEEKTRVGQLGSAHRPSSIREVQSPTILAQRTLVPYPDDIVCMADHGVRERV